MRCSQEGCPRSFVTFRSLKRHIEKQHTHILVSDTDEPVPCSVQMSTTNTSILEFDQDIEQETMQTSVAISVNLTNSFMYFTGQLQGKANISQSNIQVVVENMNLFLNDVAEYSAAKVRKLCNDLRTESSSPVVQSCLDDIKRLPQECLGKVDTHFKRCRFLRQTGALIEPHEIVLGTRIENRFVHGLANRKVTVVGDTMQYVPIESILCAILLDSGYASLISDFELKCKDYPSHLISHFFHADTFRKHTFSSSFQRLWLYIYMLMGLKRLILWVVTHLCINWKVCIYRFKIYPVNRNLSCQQFS